MRTGRAGLLLDPRGALTGYIDRALDTSSALTLARDLKLDRARVIARAPDRDGVLVVGRAPGAWRAEGRGSAWTARRTTSRVPTWPTPISPAST
jgi:hypothetical protein